MTPYVFIICFPQLKMLPIIALLEFSQFLCNTKAEGTLKSIWYHSSSNSWIFSAISLSIAISLCIKASQKKKWSRLEDGLYLRSGRPESLSQYWAETSVSQEILSICPVGGAV